jgi:glycogen debranching enzyme
MKSVALPREAIQIEDRWYVLATSSRAGEAARVLKYGESFALLDRYGDVPRVGTGEHGLYHQGTRFLSCHELRLEGHRPMLLNSNVRRDNGVLSVDATNPDILGEDEPDLLKGTVHLSRSRTLWQAQCHERVEAANFGLEAAHFTLAVDFAADFVDIFEVRGFTRERRGTLHEPQVHGDRVVLSYTGLDGVKRRTEIAWSPAPRELSDGTAEFDVRLAPGERFTLETRIACDPDAGAGEIGYGQALAEVDEGLREERERRAAVRSPNEQFNAWIDRSGADLAMLTAGNPETGYPYAGVPWYSVPFGRDGILTAMQYLWVDPGMARGVLRFLAETQAAAGRDDQDAEPGKIVHELRKGELAALGEIPFGRYYGTIDATPLFVALAGEYYQRTADLETVRGLWPAIERALAWMDGPGDPDHDGYVEYQRKSENGLVNQGWKDSDDSVFHADGRLAEGRIALAEVQGYVYLAKTHAARLADAMGDPGSARVLLAQAGQLRERFERDFWCEELGTYALALDGDKRPCRVRTSNAGHVLWSGIASAARGKRVGATLLDAQSFSGWGVRTVAHGEPRYNPMSYHNGSIWPHDNAIAAMGLARYGLKAGAVVIAEALYEASLFMDLHRLPELFCGFPRRNRGEAPTLYPVACSPQAWASATPFYLLKACLGLSFRADAPHVRFLHPQLPRFLDRLQISGLAVGDSEVDIHLERHGEEVGVKVVRTRGDAEVSVVL